MSEHFWWTDESEAQGICLRVEGTGQRKKEVKLTVSLNKNILGKERSDAKWVWLILFYDFHAPSQQPLTLPLSPHPHSLPLHLPARDLAQSLKGEASNRNIGELPNTQVWEILDTQRITALEPLKDDKQRVGIFPTWRWSWYRFEELKNRAKPWHN